MLATIAVAALVVGALALRDAADEQHTQTACAQAVAYAEEIVTFKADISGKLGKGVRDSLDDLRVACTE